MLESCARRDVNHEFRVFRWFHWVSEIAILQKMAAD
jgi:hypothetical protein